MFCTTGIFNCTIVISSFPLDIEQSELPAADQFQGRRLTLGTDENEVFDLEERTAILAAGDDRQGFDLDPGSGGNRILADEIEAKGEGPGHHGGHGAHLEPNRLDLIQLVPTAFLEDNVEEALGDGHLVHRATFASCLYSVRPQASKAIGN
jgi:hypothetical protein